MTLLLAAAGIGLTHTLLGPDHYLPFLMLARARGWTAARTLAVTGACGIAHVVSSLLLATAGVALGYGVGHMESLEAGRGDVAAWGLVAFGAAYALWGLRRAVRVRAGLDLHQHGERVHLHGHEHGHGHGHRHHHDAEASRDSKTSFWVLFTIFVLGPCEPLIPLFVIPASRGLWDLAAVTGAVFGLVTVGAMLLVTALGLAGLQRLPFGPLERWAHTMAGTVIAASGLAVIFLGL